MRKIYTILFTILALFFFVACGQEQDPNKKVYTDKDIFLKSWECGPSGMDFIPSQFLIVIETEEELAYAVENYKLIEFSTVFEEMIEQYSIEQYTYLITYDVVTTTGHYRHADRIEIGETYAYFAMDKKSHGSRSMEGPQVMGGFIHVAAVPKEYLENCDYSETIIIRPGE